MIERITALLRPTPREIVVLAKREVDPRSAHEFSAVHWGATASFAALLCIGALGGLLAPVRIAIRLLKHRP